MYIKLLFPACWTKVTIVSTTKKPNFRSSPPTKVPPPNMNHDYGTRSRTAAKDRNSTVVDLTADESAGPSRPSQNDQPAQVRTYPVFWPYWNDDGVPVPAPLGLGGKDKASPSYPPPVPPAAERACEPSSSSASGRPIIECQESKGEEYPHEPQSGWLRRELEIVFKLRAKGHSFDEISKELSKLQPRKVAERDAKACELKWVELNNNKKTTKYGHFLDPLFLSRHRSLSKTCDEDIALPAVFHSLLEHFLTICFSISKR